MNLVMVDDKKNPTNRSLTTNQKSVIGVQNLVIAIKQSKGHSTFWQSPKEIDILLGCITSIS